MPNSRDLQGTTEELPTQDEIEKRAYDLYLKSGEVFSTTEYWLIADEELKKEQAMDDTKHSKKKTAAAGAVVL
jgi:hypothetical protein